MDSRQYHVANSARHLSNPVHRAVQQIPPRDETEFASRRAVPIAPPMHKYRCIQCGAGLQPGRAGRKCAECRQ